MKTAALTLVLSLGIPAAASAATHECPDTLEVTQQVTSTIPAPFQPSLGKKSLTLASVQFRSGIMTCNYPGGVSLWAKLPAGCTQDLTGASWMSLAGSPICDVAKSTVAKGCRVSCP